MGIFQNISSLSVKVYFFWNFHIFFLQIPDKGSIINLNFINLSN